MKLISFLLNPLHSHSIIVAQVEDSAGKRYLVRTPLRIEADAWDAERQRPRNIYLKKYKTINAKLNRLKIALHQLFQVKKTTRSLSLKTLERKINTLCQLEPSYGEDSLLAAMSHYIHSRSHLLCTSTYKRYLVFLRLIERFEGHRRQTLVIEQVNADFVRDFLAFGTLEAYSTSTVHRTIHFVRTILNFLEKRGVRTFAYELELPREKQETPCITLSEDEVIQINDTSVPTALQAAKDWLIISCYTGQRVSDFMQFNQQMLRSLGEKMCVSFVQQKTQKQILLPLHQTVLKVMRLNGGSFPAKLSGQLYNQQIKAVAQLAGINSLTTVRKRQGFRSMTQVLPKWKAITSHIGRRSFASNFYGKIPTPLLMEATGHSSERMFQRYVNHADTERTLSLSFYLDKVYEQKYQVGMS
ncbi:tyrosine-type recombinase/integrase [Siphonobacter sp. SORGH_AS_1065]|uniref:tyrosine-type recombinase/integrase n=1 Tax=Siphonobacter sp. SORGH_AS_1065 TaxID=3041795 RepID=UPI00278651C8|nr:tyrosine-type recombinase/integrase [Siphonobacter sp. SORGH_AS_1065]MDQ1086143.1 site-specific recombinase XerD [Siphonobacter sp. SORGH_AS_1065]